MKYFIVVFLSVCSLSSCSSLAGIGPNVGHTPSLGDIVQENSGFLNKDLRPIGRPSIERPIALSVREIPFTKKKFKEYSAMKKGKGQESGMAFIDSLPIKPKYISLEISDRIALKAQLNEIYNKEVLAYLSTDADYRVVTGISAIGNPSVMDRLIAADGIFLVEGRNGILYIELFKDDKRTTLALSDLEVFGYERAGLCWETDRYGNGRVGSIVNEGDPCPRGTERKAHKLDRTKHYLKL